MQGDSFAFKMLLTIISLQEQSFNKYIDDLKKISETFNSVFADKSVLPSRWTLQTENLLVNCLFFQKDLSPNNRKLRLK